MAKKKAAARRTPIAATIMSEFDQKKAQIIERLIALGVPANCANNISLDLEEQKFVQMQVPADLIIFDVDSVHYQRGPQEAHVRKIFKKFKRSGMGPLVCNVRQVPNNEGTALVWKIFIIDGQQRRLAFLLWLKAQGLATDKLVEMKLYFDETIEQEKHRFDSLNENKKCSANNKVKGNISIGIEPDTTVKRLLLENDFLPCWGDSLKERETQDGKVSVTKEAKLVETYKKILCDESLLRLALKCTRAAFVGEHNQYDKNAMNGEFLSGVLWMVFHIMNGPADRRPQERELLAECERYLKIHSVEKIIADRQALAKNKDPRSPKRVELLGLAMLNLMKDRKSIDAAAKLKQLRAEEKGDLDGLAPPKSGSSAAIVNENRMNFTFNKN